MRSPRLNIALAMLLGTMPLLGFDIKEQRAPSVRTVRRKRKGAKPNRHHTPHQGARECARRVQQMSGERLPSYPRPVWVMDTIVFGLYESPRRSRLARLRFHKNLGCQIFLYHQPKEQL